MSLRARLLIALGMIHPHNPGNVLEGWKLGGPVKLKPGRPFTWRRKSGIWMGRLCMSNPEIAELGTEAEALEWLANQL